MKGEDDKLTKEVREDEEEDQEIEGYPSDEPEANDDNITPGARSSAHRASLNASLPALVSEPSQVIKTDREESDHEKGAILTQIERDAATKRNARAGLAAKAGPSRPGAFSASKNAALPGAYSTQGGVQEGKRGTVRENMEASQAQLVAEPSRVFDRTPDDREASFKTLERDVERDAIAKKNAKSGLASKSGPSTKPGAYPSSAPGAFSARGSGNSNKRATMDDNRHASVGSEAFTPEIVTRSRNEEENSVELGLGIPGAHAASGPIPQKPKKHNLTEQEREVSVATATSSMTALPAYQPGISDSIPGIHTSMASRDSKDGKHLSFFGKKSDEFRNSDEFRRGSTGRETDVQIGPEQDDTYSTPSRQTSGAISEAGLPQQRRQQAHQPTAGAIIQEVGVDDSHSRSHPNNSTTSDVPPPTSLTNLPSDANLIQAELVQERSEPNILVSAIEFDPQEDENKPIYQHKQFNKVAVGGCAFVVLVIVATVVATQLAGGGGEGPAMVATLAPTPSPTLAPTAIDLEREALFQERLAILLDDSSKISDPSSAYGKAFHWIVYEDDRDHDYKHLEQRYLMAVFYYLASADHEWVACAYSRDKEDNICEHPAYDKRDGIVPEESFRWLSHAEECDWAGLGCHNNDDSMKRIELYEYGLNGILLPEIGKLTNLGTFDIKKNKNLTGPLPTSLGQLTELHMLVAAGNKLSGPLPHELCNATDLDKVQLSDNAFSGTIPSCLSQLTRLEKLELDENKFTGTIPSEIGLLANLEDLEVDSNSLHGEVPAELCALSQDGLMEKLMVDCGADDIENFVQCDVASCDCTCS